MITSAVRLEGPVEERKVGLFIANLRDNRRGGSVRAALTKELDKAAAITVVDELGGFNVRPLMGMGTVEGDCCMSYSLSERTT
jgi:hypothetical protein